MDFDRLGRLFFRDDWQSRSRDFFYVLGQFIGSKFFEFIGFPRQDNGRTRRTSLNQLNGFTGIFSTAPPPPAQLRLL